MASDQDEVDRRRAARIPINAEFASMPTATFISDLSEYGVFVHTPTPAPPGTRLRLRFTVLLDDPVIIEGEGRVVRQQYEPVSGMGIELTDLAPEMILRINDVLSRQRPLELGPPLSRERGKTGPREAASVPAPAGEPAPAGGEDSLDTAQTLRPEDGVGRAGGLFRPPSSRPATDEHAKTGLFRPVGAPVGGASIEDDDDAEQ